MDGVLPLQNYLGDTSKCWLVLSWYLLVASIFFAADAEIDLPKCWGIKLIDLNISWFQILKGSIAIPKLSVKWLGWIRDISIFLLVKIVMYIGWNPHFWVRLPLSFLFWSNPTTVGYVGIFLPVTVIFWLHIYIYIPVLLLVTLSSFAYIPLSAGDVMCEPKPSLSSIFVGYITWHTLWWTNIAMENHHS